jgi:hypothetical protein
MTPDEQRLYKVLGMTPPNEKNRVAQLIGTVVGFLMSIALYTYSFIYAFNLTPPQGLVISWVLVLFLDAIKSGAEK